MVFLFSIIIIVLTIGIVRFVPFDYRNYLITLVSGLLGGIATLVGVIITIKSVRQADNEKDIESKEPEFFAPIRIDICRAVYIKVKTSEDTSIISNNKFYLQNTDKTPFVVDSLVVGDKCFFPISMAYIDKNCLFCITYYLKDSAKEAILFLRSIDKKTYRYIININMNRVIKIKKDDNYKS